MNSNEIMQSSVLPQPNLYIRCHPELVSGSPSRKNSRFTNQVRNDSYWWDSTIGYNDNIIYKIPPNLPFPKGGLNPSLEKRGKGRFFPILG